MLKRLMAITTMNKGWLYFILVFLLTTLSSCRTGIQDPVLAAFPGKMVEISPISELSLEDKGIMSPSTVFKYGKCFIFGLQQGDHSVDIYDTDTGNLLKSGMIGRAYGEVSTNIRPQVVGQFIYLYDHSTDKYWRIDIGMSIAKGKQEIELVSSLNQIRGQNELFIPIFVYKTSSGALSTGLLGGHKWYNYLNSDFEETSFIEDCDFDNFKGLSDLARNNVHLSSHFSVSPDGSRVICALQPAAAFSISDINGQELTESYRRTFYSCEVKDTPSGPAFNSRSNREAFMDVCSDEDNVYLLYSGQKFHQEIPVEESSYLLVLDWNGKFKKAYHLSGRIRSMCLEGNILYGVSQYPEAKMLEYSLN